MSLTQSQNAYCKQAAQNNGDPDFSGHDWRKRQELEAEFRRQREEHTKRR